MACRGTYGFGTRPGPVLDGCSIRAEDLFTVMSTTWVRCTLLLLLLAPIGSAQRSKIRLAPGYSGFTAPERPRVTAAVTTVDLFIGIQKEHHHGQVKVERKQFKIDAINVGQADAYELVGDVLNSFQTNNLLVKLEAVPSRDAAKDDHHRPIRFSSMLPAFLVAGHPSKLQGRSTVLGNPVPLGRNVRGLQSGNQAGQP